LKTVPGAADVVAERVQNGYYIDISLKPEAAARYSIKSKDLQDIIEVAIGGQNISTAIEGRMRFPIRVRYARELRDNIEDLKNLIIPLPSVGGNSAAAITVAPVFPGPSANASSGMGGMGMNAEAKRPFSASPVQSASLLDQSDDSGISYLPMSEIADVKVSSGPPMISSENGMIRSVVFLNARGRDMGSVVEDAQKVIQAGLHLPKNYTYEWSGQYENKMHAQQRILLIMPMVFLLIYMLLYFTLKDYIEALIVMLSVPFALIGGVYMIYAMGYNFSVAVWVGFIALYGVAVETGVVMVVYLHEALDRRILEVEQGKKTAITNQDIYEATIEGSALRLRPKLMTVFTAMIGLAPVLWASGTGADVMKPLTAPMVGGLLTSAVHVLIVTPILFAIMKERALKKGKLRLSKMASWMKEA
jgi:Cu(I)/Ag(I) efflux system membrane protein CusA/SilA